MPVWRGSWHDIKGLKWSGNKGILYLPWCTARLSWWCPVWWRCGCQGDGPTCWSVCTALAGGGGEWDDFIIQTPGALAYLDQNWHQIRLPEIIQWWTISSLTASAAKVIDIALHLYQYHGPRLWGELQVSCKPRGTSWEESRARLCNAVGAALLKNSKKRICWRQGTSESRIEKSSFENGSSDWRRINAVTINCTTPKYKYLCSNCLVATVFTH